jgi:putative membrane protein
LRTKGNQVAKHRFPASVYGTGDEPDPRFSLANERTFLAWIRTALALIAAGIALEALKIPSDDGFRTIAAAGFLGLGMAASVYAWTNWMRSERAMRLNWPLPPSAPMLALTVGLVAAGLVVGVGVLL